MNYSYRQLGYNAFQVACIVDQIDVAKVLIERNIFDINACSEVLLFIVI